MQHNFEVVRGFNDITVLFCRHCGKSYRLITYSGSRSRAVWEEMNFENVDAKKLDLPGTCDSEAKE